MSGDQSTSFSSTTFGGGDAAKKSPEEVVREFAALNERAQARVKDLQHPEKPAAIGRAELLPEVAKLFPPSAFGQSDAFKRCRDETLHFLKVDEAKQELVIDQRALVLAMVQIGAGEPAHARNSAAWLYQWIEQHRPGHLRRYLAKHRAEESAQYPAFRLVLSYSVRNSFIKRARELSEATVERPTPDLRHLLFALTERKASVWTELLGAKDLAETLLALRRHLVDQILIVPEKDEKIAAWRKLVAQETDSSEVPDAPESLRMLGDQPATKDTLGRKIFAQVLAERLRETHAELSASSSPGAFMAHLHGPWGSGKSSVLNFLRSELSEGDDPWLIVDFNAWKHNRLRTPWWQLVKAVYDTALKSPEIGNNPRLRWVWWSWRLRADWLPFALVGAALLLAAFFLNFNEATIKIFGAALPVVAGLFAFSRYVGLGSAKAAEAYVEMKTDPYGPIMNLYDRLIEEIGRPVAVFIDDLDRCSADYVAELIEGVQTLLRNRPVTYVIAADRKWICSAFDLKYKDFLDAVGDKGRPLGYLFLDKLFQISAALPALSDGVRTAYWRSLIDGEDATAAAPTITPQDAAELFKDKTRAEDMQAEIAKAPDADKPLLRAAAAVQITRAAASKATEHRLLAFARYLEPNPRAMKRLVNAVGMAQSRQFLEEREAANMSPEVLARWTLVELRWPLLADYLADNVDAVECARDGALMAGVPEVMAALLGSPEVRDALSPADKTNGLTATRLKNLLS